MVLLEFVQISYKWNKKINFKRVNACGFKIILEYTADGVIIFTFIALSIGHKDRTQLLPSYNKLYLSQPAIGPQ